MFRDSRMKKYFVFIAVLWLYIVGIIGISFAIIGSPSKAQGYRFDQQRISHFKLLKNRIQTIYSDSKELPSTISSFRFLSYAKDPQSHRLYDYTIVSPTSFKLCTTFSEDPQQRYNDYQFDNSDMNEYHKGYSCILYTVTNYSNTNYLTPTPTNTSPKGYLKLSTPTTGETLCLGKEYRIQWLAKDITFKSVSISLYVPSLTRSLYTLVENVNIGANTADGTIQGSYTWIVGDNTSHVTLQEGSGYYFVIRGLNTTSSNTTNSRISPGYSIPFSISTCKENNNQPSLTTPTIPVLN